METSLWPECLLHVGTDQTICFKAKLLIRQSASIWFKPILITAFWNRNDFCLQIWSSVMVLTVEEVAVFKWPRQCGQAQRREWLGLNAGGFAAGSRRGHADGKSEQFLWEWALGDKMQSFWKAQSWTCQQEECFNVSTNSWKATGYLIIHLEQEKSKILRSILKKNTSLWLGTLTKESDFWGLIMSLVKIFIRF